LRATFPAVIPDVVSESDSRAAWQRVPLVALLGVLALAELLVNRVGGSLVHVDPLQPRQGLLRVFVDGRIFLYELTAVLAALVLALGLGRVALHGDRYRAGARVSFTLIGFVCVALAALSSAVNLTRDLFFHFQLSFTFLALLITISIVGARAPGRIKLGAAILFLPLALHFAAALLARLTPPADGVTTTVDLDAIAQATLAAAAVVSVPCFAARHHARWFGIVVAAVLVAAGAVLVRVDWADASTIASAGFGIALPVSPFAQVLYLLAFGGFTFTVITLLASPAEANLRGWGLLLFAMMGLDQEQPFQLALGAVGLLCIAESVMRAAGDPLPREAFENLVRRGAAAVGAPQVIMTGPVGYENVRLHSPPTAGFTVALSLARKAGLVTSVDVTVGESVPRDPPFTIERKGTSRLGPGADGPAIDTGDKVFDARFVTRDRRGLNAQLLDEATRARMQELMCGWLGVWPQRGVQYRAAAVVKGEDALPLLIELLRDLAARAA
jgi:hypothetical protein